MTENSKTAHFFEAQKLGYDAVKHLTTLSSGTIVILATFLKDFYPTPEWNFLLPFIYGCFMLSILSSIIMMGLLVKAIKDKPNPSDKIKKCGEICFWIGVTCFLIGYLLLSLFAIKNVI
jgi:hypothetical protein